MPLTARPCTRSNPSKQAPCRRWRRPCLLAALQLCSVLALGSAHANSKSPPSASTGKADTTTPGHHLPTPQAHLPGLSKRVHKCGRSQYTQWPCPPEAATQSLAQGSVPSTAAIQEAALTHHRLKQLGNELEAARRQADRLAPMAQGVDAHTRPGATPGAGIVRLPSPEESQAMAKREQREAVRAQRRAQRHAERLAQARELAEVRAQARQAHQDRRGRTVRVPKMPK